MKIRIKYSMMYEHEVDEETLKSCKAEADICHFPLETVLADYYANEDLAEEPFDNFEAEVTVLDS